MKRSRPMCLSGVFIFSGLLVYAVFGASAALSKGEAEKSITYAKDVAPILNKNCVSCHRPGEVAPFSLTSYEDASKRAKMIARVTKNRYMPPWKADENFGEFHDVKRLSDREIEVLSAWASQGAPQGDPKQTPPLPKFAKGWTNGEPDAVFEPKAEYTLAAEGEDVYRCFVLPTDFKEDRYLTAMEVRPGNAKIVHHVIAYLDDSGQARKLDAQDAGEGYTAFGGIGLLPSGALGGWAPGNFPYNLPKGTGILLPKGSDIVLQVHYHKSGKEEKDKTKIGLYFTKAPVDKRLRVAAIANPFFKLPAGEGNHQVSAKWETPKDITVLQVMPHMHLLGKSMTIIADTPKGETKKLVRVSDWDFNWQATYSLKNPLPLSAGSVLQAIATYDNSAENPRNPNNPPKPVRWGEQTTDEMMIGFVFYTADEEHLTKGVEVEELSGAFGFGKRAQTLWDTAVKMFDQNKNGRLEPDEQDALSKAAEAFFK